MLNQLLTGAVLNATFGSIIELIIYFISLNKGLNELVVSATTGALLACMLLLPGLSMIAGGARYKEQRFNRKAGNVSAVMLFVAVAGLFMPSIYYNIFRRYRTACDHCEVYTQDTPVGKSVGNLSEDGYFRCASCNYTDHDYETDPVYTEKMEPMMYAVAVLLLLCYLVGLIFTLHTHSFIYDEESSDGEGDEELEYDRTLYGTHAPVYPTKPHGSASESPPAEGNPLVANPWEIEAAAAGGGAAAAEGSKADAAAHHGHGPQWSTRVCIAVMVSGTVCFAVCSEALVDALTPSLDKMGITENFAGLTMIALIPCIAEFSNAIQFALQDNIKLSLEIGNIAAIQMVFVQIPLLTFGSVMLGKRYPTDGFVLLYPKLNLCAVFIAVLVLTYVLVDGSSNYFQGVILLTIYVITLLVFYYVPEDLAEEL
ncbi:putative cation exchanger [Diplonema papillatum]|nr:putative cation exchanger [Diplonema papillatum]